MLKAQVYARYGKTWLLLEELEVTGFGDPKLDKYTGIDVQLVLIFPTELEADTIEDAPEQLN